MIDGKICLVTGATAGIGRVTAQALAARGAQVIITGRNLQKAEDTVREIKTTTGNESVHYLLAQRELFRKEGTRAFLAAIL